MWFDPKAALAEIESHPIATSATSATRDNVSPRRVADVADVAAPRGQKPEIIGMQPHNDAEVLAQFLLEHGPHTYGAAAAELGWGATRTWRAEAELTAAGLLCFDGLGKADLHQTYRRGATGALR